MHILIYEQQEVELQGLMAQINAINPSVVHVADSLTAVYHYAEHVLPDCVVLPPLVTQQPEFELLSALLRILGIPCFILHGGAYVPAGRGNAGHNLIYVDISSLCPSMIGARKGYNQPRGHHPAVAAHLPAQDHDDRQIILIGSSTGGIEALLQILPSFGRYTPPVVIVQHTGANFSASLIRLLATSTSAVVTAAMDNQVVSRGHVYVAAGDTHHVQFAAKKPLRLQLVAAERISGHRPSVDALFQSALPFAPFVTAAILTGMGRDGAEGITALSKAGARTIGQTEGTCVVYGMPKVAKQLGGIGEELSLPQIGPALVRPTKERGLHHG